MNERSSHQKRSLELPVVCYLNGSCSDPQNWTFGKTVEVGLDGLRIHSTCTCMLEPGTELGLLILDPEQYDARQHDAPACIRVQVCRVDKKEQVFEVRYL